MLPLLHCCSPRTCCCGRRGAAAGARQLAIADVLALILASALVLALRPFLARPPALFETLLWPCALITADILLVNAVKTGKTLLMSVWQVICLSD